MNRRPEQLANRLGREQDRRQLEDTRALIETEKREIAKTESLLEQTQSDKEDELREQLVEIRKKDSGIIPSNELFQEPQDVPLLRTALSVTGSYQGRSIVPSYYYIF